MCAWAFLGERESDDDVGEEGFDPEIFATLGVGRERMGKRIKRKSMKILEIFSKEKKGKREKEDLIVDVDDDDDIDF